MEHVELDATQHGVLLRYCLGEWARGREACGLLVESCSGGALVVVSAENVADDPAHEFAIDALTLRSCVDSDGLVRGTWHSHLKVDAQPSGLDLAGWQACDASLGSRGHLIVSMVSGQPVIAAWRLVGDGMAAPLPFVIAA